MAREHDASEPKPGGRSGLRTWLRALLGAIKDLIDSGWPGW